eukprot:EG_transcript_63916
MSGELVHCKICQKDVPRADFLKHFRECSSKSSAAQASSKPAAPTPKPKATSASADVSAPEYNENLAAAMGMDASCLPDDYDAAQVDADDFDGAVPYQPAAVRPQ